MSQEQICNFCNKNPGVKTISDATQYPEVYNGKWICETCNTVREYMKENETTGEKQIEKLQNNFVTDEQG